MKRIATLLLLVYLSGCSEGGLGNNPLIFLGKVVEGSVDIPSDDTPVERLTDMGGGGNGDGMTRTAETPAARYHMPHDQGIW